MRANPDDFLPFLLSEGNDDDGLMGPGTSEPEHLRCLLIRIRYQEAYAAYCDKIEKTSEWGGQPEVSWCIGDMSLFSLPGHLFYR